MGCACLRSGGHHRPDRGARRVAAGQRRQQVHVAGQPGPVLPAAQHLRSRGDADAIRLGESQGQHDSHPNPDAVSDAVGVGEPIGDGDRQRFGDAMPITVCDGVAITVAERHRETFDLALAS